MQRNPVRAGLVRQAWDWPWSSAAAHCGRGQDDLLSPIQMPWPVPDWRDYLGAEDENMTESLRRQTMTGQPSGSGEFVSRLEGLLGGVLNPQKPGPKPKASAESP